MLQALILIITRNQFDETAEMWELHDRRCGLRNYICDWNR